MILSGRRRFLLPLIAILLATLACEHSEPPHPTRTRCPDYPADFLSANRTYAVINQSEDEWLIMKAGPSRESNTAGALYWDATSLLPTGEVKTDFMETWIEVTDPCGDTGWVLSEELTEYVPSSVFCADSAPVELISELAAAIHDRSASALKSIVSPTHGLVMYFQYNGYQNLYRSYRPADGLAIFNDQEIHPWGLDLESGSPKRGTFSEIVLPDLDNVFNTDYRLYCNEIHIGGNKYSVEWGDEWKNFNHYSIYKLHFRDWMTWVAGMEYIDGKPYLISLSQYA
jgi:hypothetical protein